MTRTSATASLDLPVDAGALWRLIGGFGSLPDWVSAIASSELRDGGRTRHLVTRGGVAIVERLRVFDDTERSYSYGIETSPFPVVDYFSTLRVLEQPEGSRVVWSGEFTAVNVSDAEAQGIFQGMYNGGLADLRLRLSPKIASAD